MLNYVDRVLVKTLTLYISFISWCSLKGHTCLKMFGVRPWHLDIQFNVVLSFKANFKIDEKFNAKGIQNNVAWNHTAKGYWQHSPFLTCPTLRFDFHLQNSNIFVKTVCAVRKYNKIFPELFLVKFWYLILIKIFWII